MSNVFADLVFALSGNFSVTQGELKDAIELNGGRVSATVTKKCNYLVSSAGFSSAKTSTAEKYGLPIVTEAWVQDSMEGGILSSNTSSTHVISAGAGNDDDDDPATAPVSAVSASPATTPRGRASRKAAPAPAPAAVDPPAGKRGKRKQASEAPSKKKDDDEEDSTKKQKGASGEVTRVVKKGKAPVDTHFPRHAQYHVFVEGDVVYDAMLNQTNIEANNNKYYRVQLLEKDGGGHFVCWTHWGRVGKTAGQAELGNGDLASAKREFFNKFKDKSANDWSNRHNFVRKAGKYTLVEVDHGNDAEAAGADDDEEKKDTPDSKLDPRVQELIKLICDVKMMKDRVVEIGYDVQKAPLGKLGKGTIEKGMGALKQIEALLQAKANPSRKELVELSNEFYSYIPHSVGMSVLPVINSLDLVRQKLELCEQLSDIEIAVKLLAERTGVNPDENPIDSNYHKLKCDMKSVPRDSDTWKIIQAYVKNTHASTHTAYGLELEDVFEIEREGEAKRYGPNAKNPNRMLLWHGSRLTNFVGILSQGLRIAPPEAPVTGYMFGKGVYFADMVSKSANYCFTTPQNNTGVLLLCEVAVGEPNKLKQADYYADRLPPGKFSTKGCGATHPNPAQTVTLPDGVKVPLGVGVPNPDLDDGGGSLLYNEFIVYTVEQIRMRYLLRVKFNYRNAW